MVNQSNKYISAHLFFGDNLNFLLKKGIEPFLKKHQEKVENWFFIRYNENGQHIRLRIKGENDVLKPLLIAHFKAFFEKYPSKNSDIPYDKYPNNSIQFIDYQRETERYGTSTDIEVFFEKSSTFVLAYLDENLDYENALIVALLMNLHLVRGFSKERMIEIYRTIYKNWLNYALYHTSFSKDEIEQQFENIYQQQQEILEELIQDILQEHDTQTFDNDKFYHWKTVVVNDYTAILNTKYDSAKATQILCDLVHLNNNRFGISNFDEPLLAYLVLRVLNFHADFAD